MAAIRENFQDSQEITQEITDEVKKNLSEKLNNIDYNSVLSSATKINLDNFLGKYLPIFITLILSLIMYFLGFISDCFGCGPFRTLILCIYIFGISVFMLVKTTMENCKDKLKYYNETKLAGLCVLLFFVSYVLFNIVAMFVPGLNIISTFGPGKVLIPTFLALIPYYFFYIYTEQQNLKYTCSGRDFNINDMFVS